MTDQPDLPAEWTTAELLRRVDDGWRQLNERLADFPEATLELTTRRLAEYQRSGERPDMPKTVDEINEEAMASATGRDRDRLLADLATSFADLRAEIARLRDEQLPELDSWPGGVVVGNTYGHYDEHRADLEPA